MKCEDIKILLPDYSVGGLSPEETRGIKAHLRECPECRRELELLDETARLIESLPLESPPDRIWTRIASEIERETPEREPFWRRLFAPKLIPAWAGVPALAFVLGIYFGFLRSPEEQYGTAAPDEISQHVMVAWDSPFSDTAALALYIQEDLGD